MANYSRTRGSSPRAQIICDRTFPKTASTQAVVLNMTGGAGPLDNTTNPPTSSGPGWRLASAAADTETVRGGAGDMASLAGALQAQRISHGCAPEILARSKGYRRDSRGITPDVKLVADIASGYSSRK